MRSKSARLHVEQNERGNVQYVNLLREGLEWLAGDVYLGEGIKPLRCKERRAG